MKTLCTCILVYPFWRKRNRIEGMNSICKEKKKVWILLKCNQFPIKVAWIFTKNHGHFTSTVNKYDINDMECLDSRSWMEYKMVYLWLSPIFTIPALTINYDPFEFNSTLLMLRLWEDRHCSKIYGTSSNTYNMTNRNHLCLQWAFRAALDNNEIGSFVSLLQHKLTMIVVHMNQT